MDLAHLLMTVLLLGQRRGLTPEQIVTAQSLAWYYSTRCEQPYPAGHWARLAVRATLHGRDLPGNCWTSPKDALHIAWQGCGMNEVRDGMPGPDVLAEHREQLERAVSDEPRLRQLADLRIAGQSNRDVAEELGVTPGRASQLARKIAERFRG